MATKLNLLTEQDINVISNPYLSFVDMAVYMRQLWVADLGSFFMESLEDDTVLPTMLQVRTGLWNENKQLLSKIKKNTIWWNLHFKERLQDGTYVFVESLA
ncbi:MAG: hypothetical protein JJE49_08290 [Peptostreptococcaceae bacterium]|nr:hypothetical protein [Peptostreptococcaceae bacterium]